MAAVDTANPEGLSTGMMLSGRPLLTLWSGDKRATTCIGQRFSRTNPSHMAPRWATPNRPPAPCRSRLTSLFYGGLEVFARGHVARYRSPLDLSAGVRGPKPVARSSARSGTRTTATGMHSSGPELWSTAFRQILLRAGNARLAWPAQSRKVERHRPIASYCTSLRRYRRVKQYGR